MLRRIAVLTAFVALSALAVSVAMHGQIPVASESSDIGLDDLPKSISKLKKSLISVHQISVRSFESSPMFGGNRPSFQMPTYSDFELPVTHLPRIYDILIGWPEKQYILVREENSKNVMEGYEACSWLHAMQWITSRGIVYRESDLQLNDNWAKGEESGVDSKFLVGFPMESGSLDFDHGCLKLDAASLLETRDQLWELQRMELVSVLQHDPSVTYVQRPSNSFQNQPRIITRPLEDFEYTSLQRLIAGENYVIGWDADHQLLSMVAAIRAKGSCLRCHDDKARDDLLGAFTYRFRQPPTLGAQSENE